MEERSNQLTVVVGASSLAEDLRRRLVRRGVAHAGIATHLRGLRKSMVRGETDLIIVCIALDQSTIERHGDAVRQLLADCHCFPQAVRSVGLLTEVGLTGDIAELGCDVYAHDSKQAAKAVRLLAEKWRDQRVHAQHGKRAQTPQSDCDTWVWGSPDITIEVTSQSAARNAVKRITKRSRSDSGSAKSKSQPRRSPRQRPGCD